MDVPSERRCVTFSSSVESGILGPLPSIKDHTGNHTVLQNDRHSYCNYGANYPIFTSHSQRDRRWWLSRRISGDSFGMLNSWRRSTNPLPYNAMPLVHTRSNFIPTSACHQVGNYRSYRPERIEAVDLPGDPPMSITLGSTCGLCQELLTDSSPLCQELLTSTDVSVVAVLVCGHFYHADCLEGKTSEAHKRDPPCPVCFFKSTDAV
ncbi:uncharacterized protein LOC116253568 [Nymphaea colorata]|nr:uncharacterized protein LOC116253568 [Nymphaea colorata]XP_031484298.1 uncharacterized protein LOC116253568 [Nymphaea colorata]XP_049933636.1 uncharacterized protein LOC116253568 [Nymphaea colorata]